MDNISWKKTLAALACFYLAVLALYSETLWSMVYTWERMQTYAHGFLILPITAWLIWDRRDLLAGLAVKPELRALVVLAGAVLLWLLAYLVDALVIQQLALVSIMVAGTWLILGNTVTWAVAFPLAFLFFMVPVGDDLVPPMMEFTASFTVAAVKLSGIPVYREGLFFALPSGNWSVVQACSGIRYLIASVCLGCLYAYLTYQVIWKRGLFIVASIVVPVIANGLRAYMIVMIGHLSGMELATGVDHLIFGWVFFGIVMLILFSIGSIWRDPEPAPAVDSKPAAIRTVSSGLLVSGLVTALLALLLAPALLAIRPEPVVLAQTLALPAQINEWRSVQGNPLAWRPARRETDRQLVKYFVKDDAVVGIGLQQFFSQQQGRELVRTGDFWFDKSLAGSRLVGKGWQEIELDGGVSVKARRVLVRRGAGDAQPLLVVYSWYRIAGHYTANPYIGKLLEVWGFLSFSEPTASQYYLVTETSPGDSAAPETVQDFLHVGLPAINASLNGQVTHD